MTPRNFLWASSVEYFLDQLMKLMVFRIRRRRTSGRRGILEGDLPPAVDLFHVGAEFRVGGVVAVRAVLPVELHRFVELLLHDVVERLARGLAAQRPERPQRTFADPAAVMDAVAQARRLDREAFFIRGLKSHLDGDRSPLDDQIPQALVAQRTVCGLIPLDREELQDERAAAFLGELGRFLVFVGPRLAGPEIAVGFRPRLAILEKIDQLRLAAAEHVDELVLRQPELQSGVLLLEQKDVVRFLLHEPEQPVWQAEELIFLDVERHGHGYLQGEVKRD